MSSSALRSTLTDAIDGTGLELRPIAGAPPAFAITREGSQATEADRHFVIQQLARRFPSADVQASALVDLASDD